MEPKEHTLFAKDGWKGIVVSVFATLALVLLLSVVYNRLEEKRLPLLQEERLAREAKLQEELAQRTLISFLDAWQKGEAALAKKFLTENAALQEQEGVFSLEKPFVRYTILSVEQIENNEFRAHIERQLERTLPPRVELVKLLKFIDFYSIDSLEPAG